MHSRLLHSIPTDGFLHLMPTILINPLMAPRCFPAFLLPKNVIGRFCSGRHEHHIIYLVEVLTDLPALGLAAWVAIQHMYFSTG